MALSKTNYSQEFSQDLMSQVVSLCKRRGFIFASSEIYGGIKSLYDFGPLGVMLKNNISKLWWSEVVDKKPNIVGMDSSIIQHTDLWHASGHINCFSDPLVDCKNCKERFRADKQPKLDPETVVTWFHKNSALTPTHTHKSDKDSSGAKIHKRKVGVRGYVCPNCSSTDLSEERNFCGMFQSFIGAIDPVSYIKNNLKSLSIDDIDEILKKSQIFLRPETAQGIFSQFINVQSTMNLKIPFGIAQIGKAFRNEIVTEHFIFRSCEFEQMELEFFCKPGTQLKWLDYWKDQRLQWFKNLCNNKDNFRAREHSPKELAHYADKCYDIEYKYPWGWDELEGVASRTDYDLTCHAKATKTKISYFDPLSVDPKTNKTGYRYTPYVIEPSCGLTRVVLCFLLDAYKLESITDKDNKIFYRSVLKLHPLLAPYRLAILPLLSNKSEFCSMAESLGRYWTSLGISVSVDIPQKIGKRYAKHDEIGTPFALTIDHKTFEDQTFTLRMRDTMQQTRLNLESVHQIITLGSKLYKNCAPEFEKINSY